MEVFQVDPAIASLIKDMNEDELKAFTARHDKPKVDEDFEISIYAFLLMYTKFGSEKHRSRALELATAWIEATLEDDPDRERRCRLRKVVEKSVVEGAKDIGLEGAFWAQRLEAQYEQTGDLEVLNRAIEYMQTSVAFTPPEHP